MDDQLYTTRSIRGAEGADGDSAALDDAPAPIVGGYRLLRRIGAGGMGVVYLARDQELGRRVAIKLLSRKLFGDPERVARFVIEARILARFNHPGIVTVYSSGSQDGHPYLAMEHVEGRTLKERAREEPLRVAEIQRVALDIAAALREAHEQRVVHGDLKPDNVILDRVGRPRVVDFGLARMVSDAWWEETGAPADGPRVDGQRSENLNDLDEEADELAQRLEEDADWKETSTPRVAVVGSAPYLSPEQWRGALGDTSVDAWALGVMMYELLCGKHPYHEVVSHIDLRRRVSGPQPAPRIETRCDVSPQLGAVVDGCLVKDPNARLTADDLVEALTDLVHRSGRRPQLQECPFRGLEAFSEQHARFFFGRTDEVESFLERLRTQPVLPIVGASGVGKSSFVQAGVIPRLRELDEWSVVRLRPGKDPFGVLARALHSTTTTIRLPSALVSDTAPSEATGQETAGPVQTEAALAARLKEEPKRLATLLSERAREEDAKVLLLVDQLEEAATMVADREVRHRFLDAICGAADDRHEPVRVVFTARADFLSQLAETRSMQRTLENVTVLQTPGEAALHEIMTLPLRAVGYTYDDPSLPTAVIEAVGGEASALPLLQFTAALLWERRDRSTKRLRRSDYDAIGGVQGALASHADEALRTLDVDDIHVVRSAMLRLVAPDGTRRTVNQRDMVASLGPRAPHVLKRLSDARLLSVRSDEEGVQIELSHESLVHTWQRLRRWLDEGREESLFVSELSQAAALWMQRGRRRAEAWTGDALAGALHSIDRFGIRLTAATQAFLDASRLAERTRVRTRKALLVGVVALLALVALVSTVKERETERQRQRATAQRAQADAEGARAALLAGRPLEARARLRRSVETADSALARTLWRDLSQEPLLWKRELGRVAEAVAITPDGKWVAAGDLDGVISILDADTAMLRTSLRGQAGSIGSVAFSADGKTVAYGNGVGETGLWDLASGTAKRTVAHEGLILNISFHPNGNEVISAGLDGKVLVWQTDSWKSRPLGETGQPVKALAVDATGQVGVGRVDGTLALWPSTTATEARKLRLSKEGVEALAFSPNGARDLAVGFRDGRVALVDRNDGTLRRELRAHTAFVTGLRFDPTGDRLYSSAFDKRLLAWETSTGRILASFDGHVGGIYTLDGTTGGERLLSSGADREVRLWDGSLWTRRSRPSGHPDDATGLAATPDGKLLVSGGYDGTVRAWDFASGEPTAVAQGHEDIIIRVAISPDGSRAVSSSMDGSARIWSLPDIKPERVLLGHEGSVYGAAFVDDERVATTGWDGTVRLWRLSDGACVNVLATGAPTVAVAVSSDATLLVAGGLRGTVKLWRAPFQGPGIARGFASDTVYSLDFAPHGRAVAAGSAGSVAVWDDILRDAPPKILEQPEQSALNVAFSPTGRAIAAGYKGSGGRLVVWDLASGEAKAFRGHTGPVCTVAFSPDGLWMASASGDSSIRAWRTDTARPLWRTDVLLSAPYDGAHTHRGWQGEALGSDNAKWRHAVQTAPSIARQAGERACVPTAPQGVQLWSLQQDQVLAEAPRLRVQTLRVVQDGCLVVDDDAGAWLLTPQTELRKLAHGVRAVGWDTDRWLLATDSHVLEIGTQGQLVQKAPVPPGVTAVAAVGSGLALGFGNGPIELRAWDGTGERPLRDTGRRRVTFLAEGRHGTTMAGYGDGLFGIWRTANGRRLLSEKLHGPIVAVQHRGSVLRVASALGEIREVDLTAFDVPYCELLSHLWRTVPVTWGDSEPVVRAPQAHAHCDAEALGVMPRSNETQDQQARSAPTAPRK